MLPSGDAMQIRRLPPTRTSISATGTVKPCGPYQFLKCSGSCPHLPDQIYGCIESTFNYNCIFRNSAVTHYFLLFVKLIDIVVHAVKACFPDMAVLLGPPGNFFQGRYVDGAGSILCFLPCMINPARSNTLMCLEMAGKLILNGSASSLTVASPSAKRAKIARRVEFASAAKVWLSLSSSLLMIMGRLI
jgi:hypothetical protein